VPPVSVRDLTAPVDLQGAATLLGLPVDLLRDLATTGSLVAGAIEGSTLVGASVAFLTPTGLHSFRTTVVPDARRRGVGAALTWHQREWALAAGLGSITATFDPDNVACARLSLSVGAELTSYLRAFAPDGSDRLVATWALRSAPVTQAWHGVPNETAEADGRARPGPELAAALDGGSHVVGVEDGGTYLLRGPR
jgi:predicted GNAT superfamily acetyltransferase